MRKTPNVVGGIGALKEVARDSPRTLRVSAGSMIPSSHSLHTDYDYCIENFLQTSRS